MIEIVRNDYQQEIFREIKIFQEKLHQDLKVLWEIKLNYNNCEEVLKTGRNISFCLNKLDELLLILYKKFDGD